MLCLTYHWTRYSDVPRAPSVITVSGVGRGDLTVGRGAGSETRAQQHRPAHNRIDPRATESTRAQQNRPAYNRINPPTTASAVHSMTDLRTSPTKQQPNNNQTTPPQATRNPKLPWAERNAPSSGRPLEHLGTLVKAEFPGPERFDPSDPPFDRSECNADSIRNLVIVESFEL